MSRCTLDRNTISTLVAAVVVAIAAIAASAIALAQTRARTLGKLELQINTSSAAIRSDAPFPVELDLNSTFEEILDGELELTVVDEELPRMHVRVGPIAVPNGHKSFRIVLPAMSADRFPSDFLVRVMFQTEQKSFDLGTHDVLVPLNGHRQFLMGAIGLSEVAVTNLVRRLELDQYRPTASTRPALVTVSAELKPPDISSDPTGLYPFDVLLLAGEHFSRLSDKHLDTIAEWVAAGGGVAVVPTGVLSNAHKRFLERLVHSQEKSPVFATDAFGRLSPVKPGSKDWLTTCHVGFGRAIIIRSVPEFERDGSLPPSEVERWKRAVSFLWNLRPQQAQRIVDRGQWQMPDDNKSLNAARALYGTLIDESTALCPVEFPQAGSLRKSLFPDSVRVVPFLVVATVLTLFLLAIAPGDYVILGLLRRRRYTWIVFPALCFCFTAATVAIANHYSGTIDHRGALVIVDIGDKGEPLRTSRIEHVITAGTRTITTEVHNGVFAMTDVQPRAKAKPPKPAAPVQAVRGGRKMPSGVDEEEIPYRRFHPGEPLDYAGAMPGSFSVIWRSPQWTPQMHRVTTSKTALEVPPFPWNELDALDPTTERGRLSLVEGVRRIAADSELLLLFGSKEIAYRSPSAVNPWEKRLEHWTDVLAALSRAGHRGLFFVVSKISPNGDSSLEDLVALDDADTESCLLHVAIRDGNDLIVYRHFLQPSARDQHD